MELVFATNNANKVNEVQKMLPKTIKLFSLHQINCTDNIEENGSTLEENAKIKSDFVFQNYHRNCFADDTGLEVTALNGKPGVYSARYAGLENDAEKNMQKLLNELKSIKNRAAQFRTVISLYLDGNQYFFEGVCKGNISYEKTGNHGFGYDPIFIPEGFDKSFAQMTENKKNNISHRGIAIRKLVDFLKNYKK